MVFHYTACMTLQRIQYFLELARHGSFVRTAEALDIKQPTLSQQIALLEAEVGGKLFERLPRQVVLTPAGRSFLQEAQQCMEAYDRAFVGAREALALQGGEVTLGTVQSLSINVLPPVLAHWQQHFGIKVRLREYRHARDLHRGVLQGHLDLGVGPLEGWQGYQQALGEEEFVAVSAQMLPQPLTWEHLQHQPWVMLEEDNGLGQFVERACLEAGFVPEVQMRTSQVTAAIQFAASGLGITLVPRNVLPAGLQACVTPVHLPLSRKLSVFARRDPADSVVSLINVLLKQVQLT